MRWGHKSEPGESYTTRLLLYGIYKIEREGDQQAKLTYCIGANKRSRPNDFSVPKGSHQTLIHMKRQKEVAVPFDRQTPITGPMTWQRLINNSLELPSSEDVRKITGF